MWLVIDAQYLLETKAKYKKILSYIVIIPNLVFLNAFSEYFISCYYLSPVVRKPAFCICENKDTDQLRSNCAADLSLCFRYKDSTVSQLPESEITSL